MKIIDINGKERDCESAYLDSTWPGYVTVKFVSKHRKNHSYTEWYPIDKFLINNPSLSHIIEGKSSGPTSTPKEIAGVVTASGKETLRDATQNWQKNTYAGYFVWISRGTGEGQVRVILSNTGKTLKIDKPWDRKPTKESQYAIVRNIGDVKPQGNTLAIEDLRKLEKKARKRDIARGVTPSSKQYT